MSITSKECIQQIKDAVREFGTYTYGDKGPSEVMDIADICQRLMSMPVEDAKGVLLGVMKYGKTSHRRGERLVSAILVNLQDIPDDQFEVLAQACPKW